MCSLSFYSYNFTFIYLGPLSSNLCIDFVSSEVLDVEKAYDGIQQLFLPMQASALLVCLVTSTVFFLCYLLGIILPCYSVCEISALTLPLFLFYFSLDNSPDFAF